MLHVHLDHIMSDVVFVILSFQFQFQLTYDVNELEYDDSESETTFASDFVDLSSPAFQPLCNKSPDSSEPGDESFTTLPTSPVVSPQHMLTVN